MFTEIISLFIVSYFVNGCKNQKEKIKKKCIQELKLFDKSWPIESCIENNTPINKEKCEKESIKQKQKMENICDCIIKSPDFKSNYNSVLGNNTKLALKCTLPPTGGDDDEDWDNDGNVERSA